MHSLVIQTTQKKQIIDITDEVQSLIKSSETQLCSVFVHHTTAAITTADLDPETDLDMLDAFEHIIPKLHYRHPHDPSHVGDHIMASIIGPSVLVPIYNNELQLGVWQRIILVELDGPRERRLTVTLL